MISNSCNLNQIVIQLRGLVSNLVMQDIASIFQLHLQVYNRNKINPIPLVYKMLVYKLDSFFLYWNNTLKVFYGVSYILIQRQIDSFPIDYYSKCVHSFPITPFSLFCFDINLSELSLDIYYAMCLLSHVCIVYIFQFQSSLGPKVFNERHKRVMVALSGH